MCKNDSKQAIQELSVGLLRYIPSYNKFRVQSLTSLFSPVSSSQQLFHLEYLSYGLKFILEISTSPRIQICIDNDFSKWLKKCKFYSLKKKSTSASIIIKICLQRNYVLYLLLCKSEHRKKHCSRLKAQLIYSF